MIKNAQALAASLEGKGFPILGSDRGYTQTQMIVLDLEKIGAKNVENLCQASNILLTDSYIYKDHNHYGRIGCRISTHELTRQGMKETDMEQIAHFISRLVFKNESTTQIAQEVELFLRKFPDVKYSFDNSIKEMKK
jgi:glycine hydroxymethyltransferase